VHLRKARQSAARRLVPDWQELVRERLSGLRLEVCAKEEVHAELAAHLEESYEVLLKEGMSREVAFQRTRAQVTDWNQLRRQIQIARQKENIMTPRVSRLWLPSLVTIIVSMILLPLLERLGLNPDSFFCEAITGRPTHSPYTLPGCCCCRSSAPLEPTFLSVRAELALRLSFPEFSRLWRSSSFSFSLCHSRRSLNTGSTRQPVPCLIR